MLKENGATRLNNTLKVLQKEITRKRQDDRK